MRTSIVTVFASTALIAVPATAAGFSDRAPRSVAVSIAPRSICRTMTASTACRLTTTRTAFNLGAEVGYDALVGKGVIAGAYAGVEFATTKTCSEVFGNDKACLKLGRNFTLGARSARTSARRRSSTSRRLQQRAAQGQYSNFDNSTLNASDHANRGGFHFGQARIWSQQWLRSRGICSHELQRLRLFGLGLAAGIDTHRDQVLLGFGMRF